MDREETAEAIKVMQHYADGGEVGDRGPMKHNTSPAWNWKDDPGLYTIEKRSGEGLASIFQDGSMNVHLVGYKHTSPDAIKIKWEEI